MTLFALTLLSVAAPSQAADSELARLAFRSEASLIFAEVTIGDSEPLSFLLDTGATNVVIDEELARRLELPRGSARNRPAGDRAELDYHIIPKVEFRIGDHEVTLPSVVTAPFEDAARLMIGRTVHGILGASFFRRHVVEVDYEQGELVLHDPKTYRYAGDGAILPLDFSHDASKLPYATLRIETTPGEVHELAMPVDSGGSLLSTLGFATKESIRALVPEGAPRMESVGATGLANDPEKITHEVFVTRLHRVHVGPHVIERPTVGCNPARHVGHDLFGAELLRRFDVVFDYSRARMILEPNGAFDTPPLADRSALMLVAAADDVDLRRVLFVSPGSPADEAGLEAGDELVTIDARPANARSLSATRLLFFEIAERELEVRRGEEVFTTTLRARELL